MPRWLGEAIGYEIYPQSFYDSNGDGIGDIGGIIEKLGYIRDLGCTVLWLNPCFDSPFKDAGYDVRDYTRVASRYGSNEDLYRLFREAHQGGMRVLLDLVPGHTSEEHPWFQRSREGRRNEYWNRYVWTDRWEAWAGGLRAVLGEAPRNGSYIVNFFKSQPALNYGFFAPQAVWQLPMEHPDCLATREALKEVMRFWLDRGCDGFRVDMAFSLVKFDDEENRGTATIWRDIRAMMDAEYPEAALIAEWSHPGRALGAGFHGDFLLAFREGSGYQSLFRQYEMDPENRIVGEDLSCFKGDGAGDMGRFLGEYLPQYAATKGRGFISLVTGNHDLPRLALNLTEREQALAYAFILTMPGVPFLYYGDEIGMRYLNLPSKEGGYHRTGSRTPMQWTGGKNKGFSAAPEEALYLPVDSAEDAPTVEAQEGDGGSLLSQVKALIDLRRKNPELGSEPNLEVLSSFEGTLPLIYRRGSLLVAVNPKGRWASTPVSVEVGAPVYTQGQGQIAGGLCRMGPQSFGIWPLPQSRQG